jgi:predicted aminopeptidase
MSRLAILVAVLVLLQGCSTLGYYAQSVQGHLELMGKSRDIRQILQDDRVPEATRERLRLVVRIRDFASSELRLPDNGSYRSYADLQRGALVWSLVATAEFSLEPKTWCYLVIGCASYRGYFSRDRAEAHAVELRGQGMDVAVESVPAYSTLGWFDDPLPSTVVEWPEPRLAGLIFHELAHQEVYAEDDSPFNEAFANSVQQIGVERWISASSDPEMAEHWQLAKKREGGFLDLLSRTRRELEALYRGDMAEGEMRVAKAHLFQGLRQDYRVLKQDWGGYSGYDRWIERDLGNAHLASVATYENWVPAFMALFRQSGRDMGRFYAACRRLAGLGYGQRQRELARLQASG